jgi:NAD-dependent dihydropyrimidine dehydrogenase PreA subunit
LVIMRRTPGKQIRMVIIDKQRCVGCGTCVKVCHNRCVVLIDKVAHIDYDLCDRCTQCVSICPQQALSWDRVPPARYDSTRLPSAEQLDELFKERRSIRFFRGEKIERALLDEIIGYSIYAPTNNHDLRLVVVDDEGVIEELERICARFYARVYGLFFEPRVVFALLSRITADVNPHVKMKLKERRHDLFSPAAMVFVVGDRRISLSEASAQAALDHVTFYAWVKGIGSCLWGAGRMVLDRNKLAREHLGLQRREHILGVLLLGYPAVKFVNKAEGRTPSVRWISGGGGTV